MPDDVARRSIAAIVPLPPSVYGRVTPTGSIAERAGSYDEICPPRPAPPSPANDACSSCCATHCRAPPATLDFARPHALLVALGCNHAADKFRVRCGSGRWAGDVVGNTRNDSARAAPGAGAARAHAGDLPAAARRLSRFIAPLRCFSAAFPRRPNHPAAAAAQFCNVALACGLYWAASSAGVYGAAGACGGNVSLLPIVAQQGYAFAGPSCAALVWLLRKHLQETVPPAVGTAAAVFLAGASAVAVGRTASARISPPKPGLRLVAGAVVAAVHAAFVWVCCTQYIGDFLV